jgi:AraC family transcriptional regulator
MFTYVYMHTYIYWRKQMREAQEADLPVIDFIQSDAIASILPQGPLCSSRDEAVTVQHHRQPAWQTPEFQSAQHLVLMNLSKAAIALEQGTDRHPQQQLLMQEHIAVIPAKVLCRMGWNREIEFMVLAIDPTYVTEVAAAVPEEESMEDTLPMAMSDALIFEVGLWLKSELASDKPNRAYIDALKRCLVVTLVRHYAIAQDLSLEETEEVSPNHLSRAIDYIHENLARDLSLDEIAAVAQISPSYFSRLFKQEIGMTPNQYVAFCRVEAAKRLLKEPDVRVADVAERVGITSQSYFNKVFRIHTGKTPKVYRSETKYVGGDTNRVESKIELVYRENLQDLHNRYPLRFLAG